MNTSPDSTHVLRRGLEGYLRAVAAALDLPAQGSTCEISDTATAYLALPGPPDRDLMLLWDEHTGWSIAVEHGPAERQETVARHSAELVPDPAAVAAFVADTVAGRLTGGDLPAKGTDRWALAEQLSRYIASAT
ncbi:DUF6292 family protein [Actinokineospora sp.]|uniref:DUF6292 family protein n=1 Tax=Actinokineospora sp. TaxID=1872133 RepID=UPI0040378D83